MDTKDDRRTQIPESGGAMTEATGELTPDGGGAFEPAELRAITDPDAGHTVSINARRRRRARGGGVDRPGSLGELPAEELAPNDRDGGYGSEHGLSGDDPAYSFDERAPRTRSGGKPPAGNGGGGDERQAEEDRY